MIARRKGTGDEGELREKNERVRLRERWEGVEEAEGDAKGLLLFPFLPSHLLPLFLSDLPAINPPCSWSFRFLPASLLS